MNCITVPHVLMWGKSPYPYAGTFLNTGNRCGHDPKKQSWNKFSEPFSKKKIPYQMGKFMNAFKGYFFNPTLFPTLSNPKHKTNQDGQAARNRSEARDADVLVACAILRLTEFASLRVGTPIANGEFLNRSNVEIAKIAGLLSPGINGQPAKPSQRYYRSVARLKAAGFCKVHTQYERVFGEFDILPDGSKKPKMRARPAIKNISADFLVSMGCMTYEQLQIFRDKCSAEIKTKTDKYKKYNPSFNDALKATNKVRLRHALGGEIKDAIKPKQSRPRLDNNADREAERQYNAKLVEVLEAVKIDNPGQTATWLLNQARLLLPRPVVKPKP